jgi:hypothetical protein
MYTARLNKQGENMKGRGKRDVDENHSSKALIEESRILSSEPLDIQRGSRTILIQFDENWLACVGEYL